ncbi:MAG: cytochrome c oxidase assembly protein [Caldilineaceae bacterium SB0670_bin_27]|uniref:Cytochrome c oxidase assembly protein n=1 Tax=Caldilineaceae bacterium SB0664_bin_27 TaxID=2605260 RepID=A0A6B0YNU1_9CHLR|nr:cytochrome c oxidase assembly protein [Caldilineaceae bacterium SB0664_bin_27]MYJ77481.1 cytochrome c oxidase assembly protein [Caldilineaceae bacterium SB0670_bin_27]
MSPLTKALLQSWDLSPEILVPLALLGALHFAGWLRLRRRSVGRFANRWRLASYTGGILILALALLSPIAVLSGQLFSIHMVQHLLLMMVAPPLLLLANPFPTFLWALPTRMRVAVATAFRRLAHWLAVNSFFGRTVLKATSPGSAWALYVLIFFAWHDGNAYSLALQFGFLHGLEHFTFVGAALLFWWHVTAAAPRIHPKPAQWMRVAYVLAMIPPNMLLGVALSFAQTPIYPYYESVPRLYGLSVMDDQVWGGLIMWIPGSMMYVIAALALLARLLVTAEHKVQNRRPHPPVMGLAQRNNGGGPTAVACG